jgi:hypothetical protein
MIHIALFHWRPKGDRCCKEQSFLPRFVHHVWRMLPFWWICTPAHCILSRCWIWRSLSWRGVAHDIDSYKWLCPAHGPTISSFHCCRQTEIDVIDGSSCVLVLVVSSLSLLGTTHGVMVSWIILVSCVWCSVLRNNCRLGISSCFSWYVCAPFASR